MPIAQESALPLRFVVRYWSSQLPDDARGEGGEARWRDYSVHPASKLGLHNAMLVVHDRLEILAAHGGSFACALFVVDGEQVEMLSQEAANRLFAVLPRGDVKWLDILPFLPLQPAAESSRDALAGSGAAPAPRDASGLPRQLPLFPHQHTAYDDPPAAAHVLDIDV